MAQKDMVQLMHHKHEEFFWSLCMLSNELRVNQQARLQTAFNGCGGYAGGFHNVHQTQ